jgi:hypothetical protein
MQWSYSSWSPSSLSPFYTLIPITHAHLTNTSIVTFLTLSHSLSLSFSLCLKKEERREKNQDQKRKRDNWPVPLVSSAWFVVSARDYMICVILLTTRYLLFCPWVWLSTLFGVNKLHHICCQAQQCVPRTFFSVPLKFWNFLCATMNRKGIWRRLITCSWFLFVRSISFLSFLILLLLLTHSLI